MVRVLFVCTGNICRSPAAEGVLRARLAAHGLAGAVEVDSVGTGEWHVGDPPDARMQAVAAARGYDLCAIRARQLARSDLDSFDLIVAMDQGHHRALARLCPPQIAHKLRLFMDYVPGARSRDVPDPYYGGPEGFARVLDLVEAGAENLIEEIRAGMGRGK